ncbi:MAG: hypothetical protein E7554_05745 [Ruminococcaceae bacterium]|nr:hypothetical protein [Oscillospiraceae bacterium]
MNTGKNNRTVTGRVAAVFMAAVMLFLLIPLNGCASDDWEGTWIRTGDATYARAELSIWDAGGGSFEFSFRLYNGNLAGEVTGLSAEYNDSSKESARCSIPDSRAYIDFEMDEYGDINVIYGYDTIRSPSDSDLNIMHLSQDALGIIESELFGFDAPAYVTGNYTKGEVEYINATLQQAGILDAEEDERVRSLMTDDNYMRLLDCFQKWKVSNGKENTTDENYDPHERKNRHEDEIGGYVFYGSNTMQEYAAVIIIYDDGTASVVVSTIEGSPVYYSSNAIYKDGSLTPLPIKNWLEDHNKEQEKLKAAAEAKAQAEAEAEAQNQQ